MSLDVYGVYICAVCRYRVPKHIKIFQSASGWYYLTEKTEFFSIRVSVIVTHSC